MAVTCVVLSVNRTKKKKKKEFRLSCLDKYETSAKQWVSRLQVPPPRMKEFKQQYPTDTNDESIVKTVNERARYPGKWAGREAHSTWTLEHRFLILLCRPSIKIYSHTGPKKRKRNIFLKNVLLVRIRRYSIYTKNVLSEVIEFIYSDFFLLIFNTMPFWKLWSVIFFVLSPFHVCLFIVNQNTKW